LVSSTSKNKNKGLFFEKKLGRIKIGCLPKSEGAGT
jgi:hypothetical protein